MYPRWYQDTISLYCTLMSLHRNEFLHDEHTLVRVKEPVDNLLGNDG